MFQMWGQFDEKLQLPNMVWACGWMYRRPVSHLGLRSRLDLAPKRLESRLSHHLMTRLDLKFS